MKTKKFTINIDGNDVELLLKSPSLEDQREATKVYNQNFSEALKAKAIVRAKLDDVLTEQGLWNEHKQQEFSTIQNNLLNGEKQLAKGGISLKEAKEIALDMKKNREKLRELIAVKTNLDTHTAEGQADNARFNYLVFACTVYANNNQRFFKSYEDYINRATETAAIISAQHLASMIYGLDSDYEQKLPENKFLLDYKFVDADLRLINKDGQLVDEKGRLVDASGRFIDENGNYVDKDGNKVDKDGDYLVEFKPFIDDDGKPVVLDQKDVSPNESNEPQEVSNEPETNEE